MYVVLQRIVDSPTLLALSLARWIGVAVLALDAGCGDRPIATDPHPLLSTAAPVRQEMALDGRVLQLPQSGHVTVIDFWATSCEPCARMMPSVEGLWREKRSEGLSVIGIAGDDNPGLVQERLHELGVSYPNIVDADGAVRGSYRVESIPTIVVLDRQGRVRAAYRGGNEKGLAAVREAVNTVLGER